MSRDEFDILLHALPTCVPPPGEVVCSNGGFVLFRLGFESFFCGQGWEEIAFASVQHLLRSCLAKTDREQTSMEMCDLLFMYNGLSVSLFQCHCVFHVISFLLVCLLPCVCVCVSLCLSCLSCLSVFLMSCLL